MQPFELVKKTPQTNCGRCGHPSCLAYAVAVTRGGADMRDCPFLVCEEGVYAPLSTSSCEVAGLGHAKDALLAQTLAEKIAVLDFSRLAPAVGAVCTGSEPACLSFAYLGREACVGKNFLHIDGSPPADPRDQVLLCNYLAAGGGRGLAGEWVGMESLPNAVSKVKALSRECEGKIAARFGDCPDLLRRVLDMLGARPFPTDADAGAVVDVLPSLPLLLLFWAVEPEEGFEARTKILFDRKVLSVLDLESLVFATERLADRLDSLARGIGTKIP